MIAETRGLPTPFAKIVVTDDQGRYLIPDMPEANYDVWVRGYGLVDSPRVIATPGRTVNLQAVPAPDAAAAAQYYPAIYWFSLLNIPDETNFSGPNRDENIPENIRSHTAWLNIIKTTGCIACHGIGTPGTRAIPAALGHFDKSAEAWARRIQSGQAETSMVNTINRLDPQLAFQYFGDWTDPDRQGRTAICATPTAAGGRTQHRGDIVGLEPADCLHARPDADGSAQSDRQCQRQALWHDRGQHRLPPGARPGAQFGQ